MTIPTTHDLIAKTLAEAERNERAAVYLEGLLARFSSEADRESLIAGAVACQLKAEDLREWVERAKARERDSEHSAGHEDAK